jgi:hypothetical protein
MVTVSVDGLAGQHDTDTSEMIIRWMVGWFAGVSVAVGWSRSDGHGGNRSGSGTIYSVRWFGVVGVVGLEPFCATNAYVSPLLMGHSAGGSSSVRAWSIWSFGVRRHGGRGHRLTFAGERFVGLASEDAAASSIFFPMD